ncbi:MAG: pyroglutamyl-peptidase I [Bauldia sp.]|nr:pyroglutamyl-peptidase I [Bauldia sp.]
MSVILMTGFEPFGGEAVNSSWEAVRRVDGAQLDDCLVRAMQLPTVFGAADEMLLAEIRASRPDAVIMVGQAAGRDAIALERRAINRAHAYIADNAGCQPSDQTVCPDAPRAYGSTLPVSTITRALRNAGIAVKSSLSAGTFVCNSVFFSACHHRESANPRMPVGFIHVPLTPEQAATRSVATPSMPVERLAAALRLAACATGAALRREGLGALPAA